MINRGKIIEFEGLDGSFKETNAKTLYDYLKKKGYKVNIVSFPRYDCDSSHFVKQMLSGVYGVQDNINPQIINMCYALDRYDYIETFNVRDRIENGEWFIFDRYTGSSLLYQSANIIDPKTRKSFRDEMYNLEYNILNLPKPDIVIAMKSNLDMTVKSISTKEKNDAFERNITYLKRITQIYDEVIEQYGWYEINVVDKTGCKFRSKEDIFNDIFTLLNNKIFTSQIFIMSDKVKLRKEAITKCKYISDVGAKPETMIDGKGYCKGLYDHDKVFEKHNICKACLFYKENTK